MDFIEKIYERAKIVKRRILLPEGEELRVLEAVDVILKRGICSPVLIGNAGRISDISKEKGLDLKGAEVFDINRQEKLDEYVRLYCEIRKHKKIKEEEARKLITKNPVFYSALAVRSGEVDGFVAGASTTTRDVAKAAIHCIGPAEYTPTISSSTILVLSDRGFGSNGAFILADAGIIPDPTARQLADIAISSARMALMILDEQPRVAMLSYSTKGSGGSGKSIEKVQEAVRLALEKEPSLIIDGEVQLDCAVVPEVAERKDPDGRIKGRANVLIFPNLDAGNISYKFMERLAKARAIGPILQGLKKPASDLSRGCSSRDVVDAVALTALRANNSDLEVSDFRDS